jgi:hypothetical protein
MAADSVRAILAALDESRALAERAPPLAPALPISHTAALIRRRGRRGRFTGIVGRMHPSGQARFSGRKSLATRVIRAVPVGPRPSVREGGSAENDVPSIRSFVGPMLFRSARARSIDCGTRLADVPAAARECVSRRARCSRRRQCTRCRRAIASVLHLPGGGGVGDPARRVKERIDADGAAGLVSADAAEREYGARAGV